MATISDFLRPESRGVCHRRQVKPSGRLAYSEFHLLNFIFIEMLIEIDANLFLIGSNTPRVRGRGVGVRPTQIPFIASEN